MKYRICSMVLSFCYVRPSKFYMEHNLITFMHFRSLRFCDQSSRWHVWQANIIKCTRRSCRILSTIHKSICIPSPCPPHNNIFLSSVCAATDHCSNRCNYGFSLFLSNRWDCILCVCVCRTHFQLCNHVHIISGQRSFDRMRGETHKCQKHGKSINFSEPYTPQT